MKSAQIREWLEVIGIFGVIVSLVFVGMEMRQNQRIAISNASQSRTDRTVNQLTGLALHSGYIAMAEKKSSNPDQLSAEERRMERLLSMATLFIYEDIQYQYSQGFVPEERWRGTRTNLANQLNASSSESIRTIYERNPDIWSESFRNLVEEIISDTE